MNTPTLIMNMLREQQVPTQLLLVCSILVLSIVPKTAICLNKFGDDDISLRHYQDSQGDTTDLSTHDGTDGSYDSTGSSDLREDLPPPNELSVIRMNDTSVVLRWEFPEKSQDNLQFFKVQYKWAKRGGEWKTDPQEIPATTRAYQINGLKPGPFLFIVIAVYDNDDNVPSEAYKFKIRNSSRIWKGEMPEMKAPKIYWTEAQTDYFRFKWKYEPKDNDTGDFAYLVFYRSAHVVSDFTIYNTMDSSVEIAEVEPDTPYEAKVVAYNMVGVSNFSDTITIRTKPKVTPASIDTTAAPTTTSPSATQTYFIASSTSTTNRPMYPLPSKPPVPSEIDPSINYPTDVNNTILSHTTTRPQGSGIMNNITQWTGTGITHNTTDIYKSIVAIFDPLLNDQSDAMLIVRYLLLILLPILFIIIVMIFLVRPHQGKKDTPAPKFNDDSAHFDLEINGYFKNSFPGVEKEYPTVCIPHNVQNGFVNNHPHIDDST